MAKANEISFALKNCRGERSFALKIVRLNRFRSPKSSAHIGFVRLNRSPKSFASRPKIKSFALIGFVPLKSVIVRLNRSPKSFALLVYIPGPFWLNIACYWLGGKGGKEGAGFEYPKVKSLKMKGNTVILMDLRRFRL